MWELREAPDGPLQGVPRYGHQFFREDEPILVLMATPNQRDGKRVLKKVVVTHRRDYAHAYSMFAVPQRGRLNQVEKRCIAEMLFPMLSKMGILSLED